VFRGKPVLVLGVKCKIIKKRLLPCSCDVAWGTDEQNFEPHEVAGFQPHYADKPKILSNVLAVENTTSPP
jgi:hypothetical protein